MPVYDIFSKRKDKQNKKDGADVYLYDEIPYTLRVQIVLIWKDAIGIEIGRPDYLEEYYNPIWGRIFNILTKEYGVFALGKSNELFSNQCIGFLLNVNDINNLLDIIELSFRLVEEIQDTIITFRDNCFKITQKAEDAINELNERFEEHSVGYFYDSGHIFRKDSEFVHEEIVKPALSLLHESGFEGALDEFLNAHKLYREGKDKQAIAEALKAFESTMKVICNENNWSIPSNATAKPLIDKIFDKGLIPSELQSHFGGLRSALESGLPTLSNRTSRHGQGGKKVVIPKYFVPYALHLCASNIVLLINAYKENINKRR